MQIYDALLLNYNKSYMIAKSCFRLNFIPRLLLFKFSTLELKKSYVKGKTLTESVQLSAGEVLLNMTQKYPKNIALNSYEQNRVFTYEQITELAVKLAIGMRKQFGLQSKDRVGVYSLNKWQWYVLQLAAALADVILVNINPSYRNQQLGYTIQKVRVKVLFISDSFKNSNYINILKQTIHQLKDPNVNPYHINSRQFPYLKSVVRFNEEKDHSKVKGFVNFTDLFHENYSLQNLPPFPDKFDPANIQFTSGTTGKPKAATLTHHNILNNGFIIGEKCGFTLRDNICVPVPLYHCFGMVMGNLAALTRGGSLTYVCQGFDPTKALESVSKYQCTALYGVPTMFSQYLRVYQSNPTQYNIKSLRTGIIAGSLAPEALMKKIIGVLNIRDITNCYGMTQTSPVSFQTSPSDDFIKKTTTVGTILPGLQAKLIDEHGKICPLGTPGQFLLKGWAVMQGYWEDVKANQKNIVDGWMKSGDLATMDKDGFLTIVGRSKDMIIRGGQNVYPKEIQQFLNNRLKNIIDIQVVGVSDEKFGEQIAAIIKVKSLENNELTGQDIIRVCKNQIAHYKIPKYLKFVTEYPLTVTGKIQKFVIRDYLQDLKREGKLEELAIR